jgi:hypothetical protein
MGFVFENLCVAVRVLLLVGCGFVWVLFEVFLGVCCAVVRFFVYTPLLYTINNLVPLVFCMFLVVESANSDNPPLSFSAFIGY